MLAKRKIKYIRKERINFITMENDQMKLFYLRNELYYGKRRFDYDLLHDVRSVTNGYVFLFRCKSRKVCVFKANDNLCIKISLIYKNYQKISEIIILHPFYSTTDVVCDNIKEEEGVELFRVRITNKK